MAHLMGILNLQTEELNAMLSGYIYMRNICVKHFV